MSQFVALRQNAALLRDQFVAVRRATTDCCTFGDQFVAIRRAKTDCCTFAGPICRYSARCNRLLHFCGTNLSQFVALWRLLHFRETILSQFVMQRRLLHFRGTNLSQRATTDCYTFAGPICRNSARYDRLLHFRVTNLSHLLSVLALKCSVFNANTIVLWHCYLVVSYPDPHYNSCGWITLPLRGRGSGRMPNQSRSESARF